MIEARTGGIYTVYEKFYTDIVYALNKCRTGDKTYGENLLCWGLGSYVRTGVCRDCF